MGWRDLIVTSRPHPCGSTVPRTGNFEDFENIGPRYDKKSSFFIENSSQDSIQQKASSISSKLPTPDPLDPVALSGPMPPLQTSWIVAYRYRDGRLCGGCDDRAHGTVRGCTWDGSAWRVTLVDGQTLPLAAILSVGKTDAAGSVVAAWTVRTHGYDGEGTR